MSDYHARLAAIAMSNHGLNPANHAQLARWAEYTAIHGSAECGVLITGDGRLHAETIHPPIPPPDPREGRAPRPVHPPWQIRASTWRGPGDPPTGPHPLTQAMEAITEATGMRVAHIPSWEVCTGWAG